VLFDQDTPLALIQLLRPDVLVKGADYARDAIVGAAEVEGWGRPDRARATRQGNKSTTKLLERLRG